MSRAKQRLRAKQIEANEVSASRMMHVPLSSLRVAPKGDPMHDPRSLDPVDEAMAADMAKRVEAGECPNTHALLVSEKADGLLVGDGHGREKALRRASELLGGRELMPLVEFWTGTDQELLLERMRRNDHGRFARTDRASVLAFRVKQLTAAGVPEADIVAACPTGIGAAEVEALTRWGKLSKELRARFDEGAPLALLGAVIEVVIADGPEAGMVKLERLIAAGIRTARGAANVQRKERQEATGEASPRRLSSKKLAAVEAAIDGVEKNAAGRFFINGMLAGLALASGRELPIMPALVDDAVRAALGTK